MPIANLILDSKNLEGNLRLLIQVVNVVGGAVAHHVQGRHPVEQFVVAGKSDFLGANLGNLADLALSQKIHVLPVEFDAELVAVEPVGQEAMGPRSLAEYYSKRGEG